MKTVKLNALTITKDGIPLDVMGVTDKKWEILADYEVTNGGNDIRNIDIYTDNNGINFDKLLIVLIPNNGSGSNNYFKLVNTSGYYIEQKVSQYIDCGTYVAYALYEKVSDVLKYHSISTVSGYGTSLKVGESKYESVKIIRLVMNGATACIGTGTRVIIAKR